MYYRLVCFLSAILVLSCQSNETDKVDGMLWEKITLNFDGPASAENDVLNPFLDYRLDVTFVHDSIELTIPGFYAADGNAAETSAENGNQWQVRFRPSFVGEWTYTASFRKGSNIAISNDPNAAEAISVDVENGIIEVSENPNNRKGKLVLSKQRYLQFSGDASYFIKGGADSPENFLGYIDFDGTYTFKNETRPGEAKPTEQLHKYEPHIKDWQEGDPTWKGGKGKGIIGALNYLASEKINSVYFLTNNINGDGKDVWPYIDYGERLRFDCSKLDQWEIVFDHMDALGIMLHIVTQETENERLLDNGNTGPERKLYYRELIARFGHHLMLTWNMGEENGQAPWMDPGTGQSSKQQKDMIRFIKQSDPYKNPIVIHTLPEANMRDTILEKLANFPYLDGISVQTGNLNHSHEITNHWIQKTSELDHPWMMQLDEIGPASRGVDPDDRTDMNNQDSVRKYVLWGNLMAGGAGVEWYFGYKNHNNDLGCEDWRSRDRMWDYTRYAIQFFQEHLPFAEMENMNHLVPNTNYCFGKSDEIYCVYLPNGGNINMNLSQLSGSYSLSWYNPKTGGKLIDTKDEIMAGTTVELTSPSSNGHTDWVALLRKN